MFAPSDKYKDLYMPLYGATFSENFIDRETNMDIRLPESISQVIL